MIRLSKRLDAIAKHIPEDASVIDVGTDHGHLPVWLVQSDRAKHVCASDIHAAPLRRAQALAEKMDCADCIRFCVCDGLSAFTAADGDCVVLAGMGGETMVHILSQAPWTVHGTLLLLEPQSKAAELRRWLLANGYGIASEELVEDAEHIYPVLSARGGAPTQSYMPAEFLMGKWEQIGGDPLMPRYLAQQMERIRPSAEFSLAAASLLKELEQWKEKLDA